MTCEYCDNSQDKRIVNNDSVSVFVDDWRGQLVIKYYDQLWQIASEQINFCPMCGRDLRGDVK